VVSPRTRLHPRSVYRVRPSTASWPRMPTSDLAAAVRVSDGGSSNRRVALMKPASNKVRRWGSVAGSRGSSSGLARASGGRTRCR
jgi:hypothetical protein